MPVYTYQCTQCHHTQEVTHGMKETPKLACDDCGGLVKRQLNLQANFLKNTPPISQPSTAETPHVHTAECRHEHSGSASGGGCHWDTIDELVQEIESRPEPEA